MCNKTLAWGLVWMWAADTTAVGTTPGLPAMPFPWSFWAGPPAVEELTMVTPRLVWPAVDIGTLDWEAFVTALSKQKERTIYQQNVRQGNSRKEKWFREFFSNHSWQCRGTGTDFQWIWATRCWRSQPAMLKECWGSKSEPPTDVIWNHILGH